MKGRPLHPLCIGDGFHAGIRSSGRKQGPQRPGELGEAVDAPIVKVSCHSPNCTGPRIAEVGTTAQAGSFISVKYRGGTTEDVSRHIRNTLQLLIKKKEEERRYFRSYYLNTVLSNGILGLILRNKGWGEG